MKGRIVIAEDEPITRLDIRDILEEAHYEVVGEAADGLEAIIVCKEQQPDLVLLDVNMPIFDGLKAGKKIIQDSLASGIVFLSAYDDEETLEAAKKVGALGYLVKPITNKNLITTIEMAISRGKERLTLIEEIDRLGKKIDERKKIEQAKGILVANNKISEGEAYQLMRKISMDKRVRMIEVAELIVMSVDE